MKTPKKRVLLVEDEKKWRDSISLILADEYNVEVAASYGEALAKLRNYPFDVVVIDPSLPPSEPNFDGLRLLDDPIVKAKSLPAIIVTGYETTEETDAMLSQDYHIHEFFPKGKFDNDRFRTAVRNALQSRREHTEEPKTKLSHDSRSLWVDGTFFAALLLIVVGTVTWLSEHVPAIVFPVALIGTLLILIVTSVLILRRTKDLSGRETSKLIDKIISALPFLSDASQTTSKRPPNSN
jgi:CheY-like chemotaxis protein